MPERGISRYMPLIAVLALLLGLAAYYAPGVIRAWKFRSTINSMLADIRSGTVSTLPNFVVDEQKQLVDDFTSRPDIKGYIADIKSLKLSHYHREEDHIWATVTAKSKSNQGVGQGKLRWVWDGSRWRLDALNSYVSYGFGGSSDGIRIGDMIERSDLGELP